jgi:nucleoside-diphosphate-sugar epimerase
VSKYYKNKRVLVTGADGFMGSHLTERLFADGAKVSVYVRGNSSVGTTQYNLKNIKPMEKKFEEIITGDIASPDCRVLVKKNRPDIILRIPWK